MSLRTLLVIVSLLVTHSILAKECWGLTDLKGQIAASLDKYVITPDKFSNPMVLCFRDNGTGIVTGDDTSFVMFGTSTLIGMVQNNGFELIESYQIDRKKNKVLFIKSRIGTTTVIPNGSDIISAFVGNATKLKE